jgi:hypothetical protein
VDTVAKGEMAESSIVAFIAKRDKQRRQTEGERAWEKLWAQSMRAYNARCGEERCQELLEFWSTPEGQAARLSNTLEALVRYHWEEAEKYRNGHEEEILVAEGEGGR